MQDSRYEKVMYTGTWALTSESSPSAHRHPPYQSPRAQQPSACASNSPSRIQHAATYLHVSFDILRADCISPSSSLVSDAPLGYVAAHLIAGFQVIVWHLQLFVILR